MRIISKFKDYYDWVVFETDNRKIFYRDTKELVFDKNIFEINPANYILSPVSKNKLICQIRGVEDIPGTISICINFCDQIFWGIYIEESSKYFWEYSKIPNLKKYERIFEKDPYFLFTDIPWAYKKLGIQLNAHFPNDFSNADKGKNQINDVLNCPIILETPDKIILNPNLSALDFSLISPSEAYQMIYNFIELKELEMPSNPMDQNRFETKGFNKMTSFRPKMKKK